MSSVASWYFTVVDSTTGAPIEGAAVNAIVNTQPCPFLDIGCTSGTGYTLEGNTDSNGQFVSDIPYTTEQSVDINVSAVGYNPTTASYQSGYISGDVYIPTIQLTPNGNVAQKNQGAGGTAATQSTLTFNGFLSAHQEAIEIVLGVVIAVIVLVMIIHAIRGS